MEQNTERRKNKILYWIFEERMTEKRNVLKIDMVLRCFISKAAVQKRSEKYNV